MEILDIRLLMAERQRSIVDWVELEGIKNEARISHASHKSGLPIPAVGEIVHVIRRMGLIYQRVEGDSFYKAAQCKPGNIPRYCRRIAELHVEIYPVYPPPLLPTLPRWREGISPLVTDRCRGQVIPNIPQLEKMLIEQVEEN